MEKSKRLTKKDRLCKQYQKISFETRKQLIKLVEEDNFSIKKASETVNINYSTGKLIVKKYRVEGKITVFSYEKNQTLQHNKQQDIPPKEKSNQKDPHSVKEQLFISEPIAQQSILWYWLSSYNWALQNDYIREHNNFDANVNSNTCNQFFYCWNF